MPSEQIGEVIAAIGALQGRVQAVDAEATRLAALRGDITSLADGVAACSRELRAVAAGLAEGASTMRQLDMAATMVRIAQIEAALLDRSDQLQTVIARELAEFGESVLNQLAMQLDAVATRLEPIVSNAFGGQMTAIIDAVATASAASKQRHAEGAQRLEAAIGTIGETVVKVQEVSQAVREQLVEVRQSLEALKAGGIDALEKRIDAHAHAAESATTRVETLLTTKVDRLAGRVSLVGFVAIVGALAAIGAVAVVLSR